MNGNTNRHFIYDWALIFFLCSSLTACAGSSRLPAKAAPSGAETEENVIRVGISTNSPPLAYKERDEIAGLEPELAGEFAAYLGKKLRFVEVEWVNQIQALLDKRTDIIMSGMSITRMREVRIAFSKPYFRSGQMALVPRKDKARYSMGFYGILGQSIKLRIGVVEGTTGQSFVQKTFGSAKKIVSYKNSKIALEKLLVGKIDMLIHDAPIVLMMAAENESKGLSTVPSLLTEEYMAWGMRKTDTTLIEAANGFIDHLNENGRLDTIIRKWIPYSR